MRQLFHSLKFALSYCVVMIASSLLITGCLTDKDSEASQLSDEQIERINDLEKTVGETKAEAVKLDKQSIVQEQRVEDFTEQVQMIDYI